MKYYCRRYKYKGTIFKVRAEEYDAPQLWGEWQCGECNPEDFSCYWLDAVPFVEEHLKTY